MATFMLDGFPAPVPVVLTHGITESQLLNFKAFQLWRDTLRTNLALQYSNPNHTFHDDPFSLQKIEIQSVDWFPTKKGSILGFVKLRAYIRSKKLVNGKPRELPGIAFLRGGSVAMLMILRPQDSRDERWVVMTEQPRVPAGSLSFVEIPAGMLDNSENFSGKAAEEILEETGFKLPKSELIDLTELALKQTRAEGSETLQNAMYPSPGGSDEFIPIFLWEKVSFDLRISSLSEQTDEAFCRNSTARRSWTCEGN